MFLESRDHDVLTKLEIEKFLNMWRKIKFFIKDIYERRVNWI